VTIPDAVEAEFPGVVTELRRLVAIESVSADPARADQVERSAQEVADLITAAGCDDVQIVRAGGAPAVIARFPAPAGRPTVCLYAHHDVQPEGDPATWSTEPFAATERHGRLFGRGAADDKGGFAVHLAALRAFGGRPPVGVTLFIEGEEEVGSPSLRALLAAHREELASDVFVIADSSNWEVGTPAFTTSLRGLADCVVTLRTLDHAVHSGAFGGVVPDALTAMCRLLATLHDERGNVAVAGLHRGPGPDLDYPEDRLRAESGILDGVHYLGDGSVVERLWTRPAISVIALDATSVAEASNTLIPAVRAKISLRLAPGEESASAMAKLRAHLESHVAWGAQLEITGGDAGEPSVIAFEGPYAAAARDAFTRAWGKDPVLIGQGGSIPMVAEFAEAFPAATVLVTAVSDPDSRMHGANESVHLGDLKAACLAEALFLESLGEQVG
jgi:acetylornithine deacetylase/succinyl-diaminopimelate desuccinylase-like protein